jgi:hypothetical protein
MVRRCCGKLSASRSSPTTCVGRLSETTLDGSLVNSCCDDLYTSVRSIIVQRNPLFRTCQVDGCPPSALENLRSLARPKRDPTRPSRCPHLGRTSHQNRSRRSSFSFPASLSDLLAFRRMRATRKSSVVDRNSTSAGVLDGSFRRYRRG